MAAINGTSSELLGSVVVGKVLVRLGDVAKVIEEIEAGNA